MTEIIAVVVGALLAGLFSIIGYSYKRGKENKEMKRKESIEMFENFNNIVSTFKGSVVTFTFAYNEYRHSSEDTLFTNMQNLIDSLERVKSFHIQADIFYAKFYSDENLKKLLDIVWCSFGDTYKDLHEAHNEVLFGMEFNDHPNVRPSLMKNIGEFNDKEALEAIDEINRTLRSNMRAVHV